MEYIEETSFEEKTKLSKRVLKPPGKLNKKGLIFIW